MSTLINVPGVVKYQLCPIPQVYLIAVNDKLLPSLSISHLCFVSFINLYADVLNLDDFLIH